MIRWWKASLMDFLDLVTNGEGIEEGIKSGKIQGASYNIPYNPKRHVPKFSKNKEVKSML